MLGFLAPFFLFSGNPVSALCCLASYALETFKEKEERELQLRHAMANRDYEAQKALFHFTRWSFGLSAAQANQSKSDDLIKRWNDRHCLELFIPMGSNIEDWYQGMALCWAEQSGYCD